VIVVNRMSCGNGGVGMAKVLWHTMLSLDGFIAGPDDDMGALFGVDGGPGETVGEVVRSTGALLVGRRTQDVEDRLQPGFYGGALAGPSSFCATIRPRSLPS
jgi:hypothetical protein